MLRALFFVLASCLLGADPAYAYIDPNMGGWLYQLLFPVVVALAGAWAVMRQKIAHLVSRLLQRLRSK